MDKHTPKRTPPKRGGNRAPTRRDNRTPVRTAGSRGPSRTRTGRPPARKTSAQPASGVNNRPNGRRQAGGRIHTHRSGRAISRSVTLVAGIFFIFVSVYLVRSLYAVIVTQHIPTEVVKPGSVDLPRVVSGIIIRDEQVYYAERDGRITYSVSDYERVKPGAMVCSIQDVAAVEDINRSMASIEEQIIELQQIRQDISAVDPAVQRVNAQIKNIVDSRLQNFTVLNISELYALKENVSQSITVRNQMILDESQNIKEDLNYQQQQLMTRLNTHAASVKTTIGGVMSPVVDGLEGVLTREAMQSLSREQTRMTVDYNKIIPQKDVKSGDPVFKIVSHNDWYIAAYMPNEMIEGYEESEVSTIYLEKGDEYQPLTVSIEKIDTGYRESFVIFKCTKNMIDYLNMRNVNIKTTDSVRKGLKISVTALATRSFWMVASDYVYETDKTYHVVKSTEEGNVIVPVVPSDSDSVNYYIPEEANSLTYGDVLIGKNPESPSFTVSEQRTSQGVYRVNNGFAEFRSVTLDEDASLTGGYVILNTALEQGVRTYDYIISDASGVKEGQIIK